MFRLYFLIFWSTTANVSGKPEATLSMKIPMLILAAGSLLVGLVPFSSFVTPDGVTVKTEHHLIFSIAPVLLAIVGLYGAAMLYKTQNNKPERLAISMVGIYKIVSKKLYIDELYIFITKRIIFNLIGRPAAWIDKNVVDGFMNLLAKITAGTANMIKGLQSGKVQNYALFFFGGIAGLAVLFIYLWK